MILGGDGPLVVGDRVARDCTDHHGVKHASQPFVVLREATADEMLAQCREHGVADEPTRTACGYAYFYDVSID